VISRKKHIMKSLFTVLTLLLTFSAHSQTKFPPIDDSSKDEKLKTFVATLKATIKERDGNRLISMIHPDMKITFDGENGIDAFRKEWKPEDKESDLWILLNKLVGLGGVFLTDPQDQFYSFVFPYVNKVGPVNADDYFNILVVTATDVNVREKPDFKIKNHGTSFLRGRDIRLR
jgi:hypothetical protein